MKLNSPGQEFNANKIYRMGEIKSLLFFYIIGFKQCGLLNANFRFTTLLNINDL